MTRRGFTLIELLVVIAIIAILAAILFPVFARARAKAQQNNCLSNTKQLVLACLMYTSDNDDKWMYNPAGACAGVTAGSWAVGIFPYIKNGQIYQCPTAVGGPNPLCASLTSITNLDYNYNSGLYNIPNSSVKAPAMCIALHEGGDRSLGPTNSAWGWGSWQYVAQRMNLTPVQYGDCLIRHNDGCNYGFCDGHAKWMKMGNIGQNATVGGPNGVAGTYSAFFDYNAG